MTPEETEHPGVPDERDLLAHVVDYLCGEQAESLEGLSDAEIERRARLGIARAQLHGLDQAEAITAYVSLMFLVAPDFDRQPNIRKVLQEPGVPAPLRLQMLFKKTAESDWEEAAEQSKGWDAR